MAADRDTGGAAFPEHLPPIAAVAISELHSLTGSARRSARGGHSLRRLRAGSIHLVVGTHALVEGDVRFHQLGLVGNRRSNTAFGVLQRAMLREKEPATRTCFVMTATPFLGTLALTLYGDLTCRSSANNRPDGFPFRRLASPRQARRRYTEFVRGQLDEGRQGYIIYPLVEDSDKIDVKAATRHGRSPCARSFPAVPNRIAARPNESRRQRSG